MDSKRIQILNGMLNEDHTYVPGTGGKNLDGKSLAHELANISYNELKKLTKELKKVAEKNQLQLIKTSFKLDL